VRKKFHSKSLERVRLISATPLFRGDFFCILGFIETNNVEMGSK